MVASTELKKRVYKYCISERKKIKHIYGQVCVGVEDSTHTFRVCSHSFEPKPEYVYYEDVSTRLTRVGIIGKYHIGNCYLGCCAEPHAANKLIIRLNKTKKQTFVTNSGTFIFSKALRIRTQQEVKYCKICKQTFEQL